MGFWSTVLIFVLLLILPCLMIVLGAVSRYGSLKNRSSIVSYRSKRAKKTEEAFRKANSFYGLFMFWMGFSLFILAFVAMWILTLFNLLNTYSATIIIIVEAIVFLSAFYITELYLKRTAEDEDRKEGK